MEISNDWGQNFTELRSLNLQQKRRLCLHAHIKKRLLSKTFAKVTIIDIGTVAFGIAVGFLALLNQGSVTGIRVMQPIDIIGLGLGIGSLRELANKA